jgi:hypothetical protein
MAPTDETPSTSGMPAWMKFATTVGIPSAGLAYLVYMLASSFSAQLTAIDQRLEAHERQGLAVAQHLQVEADQSWRLLGVMQRICINTAQSDEDKKACTTMTERPR